MSRPQARKPAGGVSLFPFLAVLICTMGSLIVLLVLVVKQAEVQAGQQRQEQMQNQAQQQRQLEIELEDQELLRTTLEAQRPEMTQKLADARGQLSHLEDHIRQLKKQAERLRQQVADLAQLDQLRKQDRSAAQAELASLRQRIEQAEQALAQARKQAARQRRSYAIVPYPGRNGTTRRPIYIECTPDAVILQPEGVRLEVGDFNPPLVPGNPLDAALLAIRQHLANSGALAKGEEPYPLLIVRPGGAEAYAMCRSAMKSWEDEFGYELIDDQIQLRYPPADPVLREVIERAIADARRRQAALALAQPARFADAARIGPLGRRDTSLWPSEEPSLPDPLLNDPADPAAGRPRAGSSSRPQKPDAAADQQHPADRAPPPGASASAGAATPELSPLAATRGSSWALPSRASGAIAYTRPIAVLCTADRLVVFPPAGSDQLPAVTPLNGPTRAAIDPFISSIWKHMEAWGIAGTNAYWKPVLSVEVAPGGQRRFEELQQLLRGSGLQIVRKQRSSPAP